MIINRVITSYQAPDDMEKINELTDLNIFATDNWVDYSVFEDEPKLKKFVEQEKLDALRNGEADYIAFRLDC